MKKIIFEGTEQEMTNLKSLIADAENVQSGGRVGKYSLPKMIVMSERDIIVDKLAEFVSDDPEESYDKLLKQNEIDANVMADDVVLMWEPLENRYTVADLLDEIT